MIQGIFGMVFRSVNAAGDMVTDGTVSGRQESFCRSSGRNTGRAPGLISLDADLLKKRENLMD